MTGFQVKPERPDNQDESLTPFSTKTSPMATPATPAHKIHQARQELFPEIWNGSYHVDKNAKNLIDSVIQGLDKDVKNLAAICAQEQATSARLRRERNELKDEVADLKGKLSEKERIMKAFAAQAAPAPGAPFLLGIPQASQIIINLIVPLNEADREEIERLRNENVRLSGAVAELRRQATEGSF
jgi:uncharacterized protein YdcH (DUF465 family)